MFEKPLTPSDVGKLNRLVIPKQHAERYFPLAGEAVEKGLLLSFEDESGKCWRFRYSYWNSSQSYVLTKGWSRYVKEKQLDAGDVVFFQRHRSDPHRLFIAWRRRGSSANNNNNTNINSHHYSQQHYNQAVGGGGGVGWGRGVDGGLTAAQPYLEDGGGGGGAMRPKNVGYQQPECVDEPGNPLFFLFFSFFVHIHNFQHLPSSPSPPRFPFIYFPKSFLFFLRNIFSPQFAICSEFGDNNNNWVVSSVHLHRSGREEHLPINLEECGGSSLALIFIFPVQIFNFKKKKKNCGAKS
ncbi:unnamed protein product [Linum tenue]|uniref:TF-B3 domain-containing protein n=1 Tax=Linum tenue TaxID=586396 RepID=A0AAV0L637_9ROSI|nr:unnamed protein product [Linum tenue]